MHDVAARLNAFVTSSAAPYGKEYSVRWRSGSADHDRFLISIHRLALADSATEARRKLEPLLRELRCPPAPLHHLWEVWNDTCVVHLGYEHTAPGQPCVKIYFELTETSRVDMRQEQLIHVAVKWSPLKPEDAALSRYSLVPCQNRSDLVTQLHRLCPAPFVPTFERLIDKAMQRCAANELMLLSITDDNTPRKSCDLNLYNGQMTIDDGLSDLLELAALNGCHDEDWLTAQLGRQFGHLAAGRDRDGNDFATLYFGVEAH